MRNGDPESPTAAALLRTCRQALEDADLHFGHGTDNAADEAAWLVLHALGQPVDGHFDAWDMAVGADKRRAVQDLLRRRIETRQPLAYLLGEAWFCGLPFEVSRDVLVPRSPLAELIPDGFRPWLAQGACRALDLCTGSGCIAVALAVHQPQLRVTASDISRAALALARRNAARHRVEHRVDVVHSDLFAALAGRRFDLIVSNPPYVPAAEIGKLPAEYQAEPALGLASGRDGLDCPLRILLDAANYLDDAGILVCEVGANAERLQDLLPSVPFTWLEFVGGGEGVFQLDRATLEAAGPAISRAWMARQE